MSKIEENKKKTYPNFLGDDFLFSVSNVFLSYAGLIQKEDEEKDVFLKKILPDFLEKVTIAILDGHDENTVKEMIEISKKDIIYEERKKLYKEIIPDFEDKLALTLELFEDKINLGLYTS